MQDGKGSSVAGFERAETRINVTVVYSVARYIQRDARWMCMYNGECLCVCCVYAQRL